MFDFERLISGLVFELLNRRRVNVCILKSPPAYALFIHDKNGHIWCKLDRLATSSQHKATYNSNFTFQISKYADF